MAPTETVGADPDAQVVRIKTLEALLEREREEKYELQSLVEALEGALTDQRRIGENQSGLIDELNSALQAMFATRAAEGADEETSSPTPEESAGRSLSSVAASPRSLAPIKEADRHQTPRRENRGPGQPSAPPKPCANPTPPQARGSAGARGDSRVRERPAADTAASDAEFERYLAQKVGRAAMPASSGMPGGSHSARGARPGDEKRHAQKLLQGASGLPRPPADPAPSGKAGATPRERTRSVGAGANGGAARAPSTPRDRASVGSPGVKGAAAAGSPGLPLLRS